MKDWLNSGTINTQHSTQCSQFSSCLMQSKCWGAADRLSECQTGMMWVSLLWLQIVSRVSSRSTRDLNGPKIRQLRGSAIHQFYCRAWAGVGETNNDISWGAGKPLSIAHNRSSITSLALIFTGPGGSVSPLIVSDSAWLHVWFIMFYFPGRTSPASQARHTGRARESWREFLWPLISAFNHFLSPLLSLQGAGTWQLTTTSLECWGEPGPCHKWAPSKHWKTEIILHVLSRETGGKLSFLVLRKSVHAY